GGGGGGGEEAVGGGRGGGAGREAAGVEGQQRDGQGRGRPAPPWRIAGGESIQPDRDQEREADRGKVEQTFPEDGADREEQIGDQKVGEGGPAQSEQHRGIAAGGPHHQREIDRREQHGRENGGGGGRARGPALVLGKS